MAKQFGGGRRNSRTSFGKRQEADDAFRKKKKEKGRGDEGGGAPRSERRTSSGSRYVGGARKFSPGRRRDDDRGDKKPFGASRPGASEGRSFGAKRPRRSFDKPEGRSFDKPRRSFDKPEGGSSERPRRSYNKPEGRSGGRSFDKPKRGSFNRSEGRSEGRSFDKPKRRSFDKPERRSFVERKVDNHRDRVEAPQENVQATPVEQGDGLVRLNKFISNSGVCSRREADELIKMGVITVNGVTVTEMGHKVKPTDDVRHDGKKLTAEKPVYILLNKPKGFITTTDDPQERNTVMQLIAGACKERVYPVGRLDRNTTGLLLLTNDGDLTDKLTHPSFNAKKIYKVELDKPLTKADFEKIVEGVKLEEGKALVDDLAIVSDDSRTVGIELHIGWNHVVRRIFNALEYDVVKLDRVVYAGLDKKDLKRGQWRFLKTDEIVRLKHFK